MSNNTIAPGAPGTSPRWTISAKSGVGKSYSDLSTVLFTISHGILDEIYYPRVDTASTRDMEFIDTDGEDFFSEEKGIPIILFYGLEKAFPLLKS